MRSDRGIALITTLIITAVLVTLIAELSLRVYLSAARADNVKNSAKASLASIAGVRLAKAGLEELSRTRPDFIIGEEGLSFSQPVDEGVTIEIKALDERARASLRTTYPTTGLPIAKADGIYSRLLKNLKLNDDLRDTLADWIDSNSEPRPRGAEDSDYYRRLDAPYSAKNNYLYSEGELLLIKGYDNEAYNKLAPFVTAHTDGTVNINTAGKEVLSSLAEGMDEELANRLIEYRKKTPFKDRSDVMKVPGFETIGFALQDKITTRTEIFRIRSKAKAGELVREAEAVVQVGGAVIVWKEE